MRTWPVQDAKARFSAFLEASMREGPQLVSKRRVASAELIPIEEWQRLRRAARPSLKELLLAEVPRSDIPLPQRGRSRRRAPEASG
jgi:antitoxin Phd